MHKVNPSIAVHLKSLIDHFDLEGRPTREIQIRRWRRLKLLWNGFSQYYWSESARDYKIYGSDGNSDDQSYYDRPVNVFKAFLETIIAALSIQIPAISCIPDDADNPLDISTARAGSKIAAQIYKHNNVSFLWLHALYVWCTEGLVACYSYPKTDKQYGTFKKKKYKDEEIDAYVCPICQNQIPDEEFSAAQLNKFQPNENDVSLDDALNTEGPICLSCGEELNPGLQKSKLIIPRLVGETDEPKTRICLEIYGGLYVQVANYARMQSDTPYLKFAYETHYANALEFYPDLREDMPQGGWSNIGMNDPYEQYGRLNTQYMGDFPNNNVTINHWWFRPAAFNILDNEAHDKLKKLFPDGVKVVQVNDLCAEYENESLDDCWTLTRNPLSDYLTHEPLGELLVNIQEITNDLISLTLQTIEQGIAQTWVDPAVVNVPAYGQLESAPGTLTATKPVAGNQKIGDAFFTSKQASLSPEIFNFYRIVQELGQFVSGALPSLFGGAASAGGSRTASEYAMSRSGAQQRLQTPWKTINVWWKEIFMKVIPMYMKEVQEDERVVEKDKQGNYINTFIRKAELDGKIGDIELESSDRIPITDEQQGEIIKELMALNNSEIQKALLSPENLPSVKKAIRVPDFMLPGEEDRQKQYEEIQLLVNTEPVELPPDENQMMMAMQTGQQPQPTRVPSVEIDPLIDNHEIEAEICRTWLISSTGRLAKIENPSGYENVLLHYKAHIDMIKQQLMSQQTAQAEQENSVQTGKPARTETVKKDSDARTPIV